MILPKITIITPTLNHSAFIEKTIQSIICQNYPNLEYIIIDGGSTDGTQEIIKKFESYITYWESKSDEGQYDALNRGFCKASGDVMAWLNSDDIYLPWTLHTVGSIFASLREVDWITTVSPGFIDKLGLSKGFLYRSGYSRDAFSDGFHLRSGRNINIGMIQQESTFWRRSLWERAGGYIDTMYGLAGDYELWKRFFDISEIHVVDSPLACYRVHDKARSRISGLYRSEATQVMNKVSFKRNISYMMRTNFRKILYSTKLIRIPLARSLFFKYFGYTGRKIVRINDGQDNARWIIKQYRF